MLNQKEIDLVNKIALKELVLHELLLASKNMMFLAVLKPNGVFQEAWETCFSNLKKAIQKAEDANELRL